MNLGNFTSEWNWLESNSSHILRLDNKLYHEQYYDHGTVCELNQKQRRTTIKLFCDEMTTNHIESINEIETCVYEIHVHSYILCNIKHFTRKLKNLSIKCNPVLNDADYESYIEAKIVSSKNDENLATAAAALEGDNGALMSSIESIDLNVSNEPFNSIEENKKIIDKLYNSELDLDDLSVDDNTQFINELSDQLLENEEKLKNLREKTELYENLLKNNDANGDLEIQDNDNLNNLLDTENLNKEITNTQNELIKSADDLVKTNELLKKLTDKLSDIIENLEVNDIDKGNLLNNLDDSTSFNSVYDNLYSSSTNEYETSESVDEDTTETTTEIDSSSSTKKTSTKSPVKIKVSVLDPNSNIAEQLKKIYKTGDNDENSQYGNNNKEFKNIEEKIKNELMKKNEKKYKDVDIKIINIDTINTDETGNLFGDVEGDGQNQNFINKLFSSLFGDVENKKKVNLLNKNYNLVFNDGRLVNDEDSNDGEYDENGELIIRY